jgi:hypothetical protein
MPQAYTLQVIGESEADSCQQIHQSSRLALVHPRIGRAAAFLSAFLHDHAAAFDERSCPFLL